MMRAFRSEWPKLLRIGHLLSSWGAMAGFGILLSVLLLTNAKDVAQAQDSQRGPPAIPITAVEKFDGGILAFQASGQLLGIIALVVAAANMATEYTSGTLKALLVREPRRPVLFAGKVTALWTFILIGITVTLVVALISSFGVAAARGIDTSAWWTTDGFSAMGQALLNVTGAAFVWALMGMMLAVLFRSGFPAIGIGIAYPLVVENLLGIVLKDLVKWMPGSVLGRLADGNTAAAFGASAGITYSAAVLLAVAYAAVFSAISIILLMRRDVN